ncbi:MAG TPA: hypothetical protein VKO83_04815 [Steroidobacteraceae bacterium]|nr:hypothetical protein [Steroidobacteraceae bacterium]
MNAGRKLIRNTVFGLWGTAALFVGLNRLNATPAGGGAVFTLGLMQGGREETIPEIDLADARDFTSLSVRGRLRVEVVGAAGYSVTLTPAAGQSPEVHAYLEQGVLHVDGGDTRGALQGVLRLEVPTLQRIDAATPQITVHGLAAPGLGLYLHNGGTALLQQNQVKQWQVFSADPLELSVDDATFAAGTLKATGDILIRRAP